MSLPNIPHHFNLARMLDRKPKSSGKGCQKLTKHFPKVLFCFFRQVCQSMGDGFTKEKVFLGKKTLVFLLRANFPVTLQNLNFSSLVSEKCGQFLFSSEEFPHSDTDSMEIHCLIWVMGKWPQIQASLQWNNHSKLYFFQFIFLSLQ